MPDSPYSLPRKLALCPPRPPLGFLLQTDAFVQRCTGNDRIADVLEQAAEQCGRYVPQRPLHFELWLMERIDEAQTAGDQEALAELQSILARYHAWQSVVVAR